MTPTVEASPGVYVRGLEAIEAPITETAVAGFVGISERGPIRVPQPLRSFGEYLQVFGRFVPYGTLAECVHAFFQNGGEKCWVVRAADTAAPGQKGPCPPPERLAAATFGTTLVDAFGTNTLEIEALDQGSWGNEVEFAIDASAGREIALTTLRAPATSAATTLDLESVADVVDGASILVASPRDPLIQVRSASIFPRAAPCRGGGVGSRSVTVTTWRCSTICR